MIECPDIESNEPSVLALNGCGSTIQYPYTFTWTHPNPDPSCRYDLIINGVDQGPSVQAPVTSWLVTSGPSGQINVQLWKQVNNGTFELADECTYTVISTEFKIFAEFPGPPDTGFGGTSEAELESYFTDTNGGSYNFGVESLASLGIDNNCLLIEHIPNTAEGQSGSSRTIFVGSIQPSPCYCVEQKVALDTLGTGAFDYGGQPGNETIKLGFGIGAGTRPTGGSGFDPCGATFRFILRGTEIMGYSYAFGRPGTDVFGQDIPTGVTMVPDREYSLKAKLCMNTDNNADGSYEIFIDGALVASNFNYLWMNHTDPSCPSTDNLWDSLIFNSFYGGTNSSTQSWPPDSPQYIQYCQPCYTPLDA